MVHPVQPPQGRHGVDHDVLQPDDEVHGDHRQRHGDQERHLEVVDEAPAVFRAESRHAHRRQREDEAQQHRVEHHQAQVAGPAQGLGYGQGAARRGYFPESDQGEHAQEKSEPDDRLVGQHELFEVHESLSLPTIDGLYLSGDFHRQAMRPPFGHSVLETEGVEAFLVQVFHRFLGHQAERAAAVGNNRLVAR